MMRNLFAHYSFVINHLRDIRISRLHLFFNIKYYLKSFAFFSEKRNFGKQLQNITNNYKNIFFILLWNLRFKTIFSWKLHCFFRFQKSLIFNFFSIKTYFCWWKKWVFVKKGCNRLRPSANKNPRIVFRKIIIKCAIIWSLFCEKIVKLSVLFDIF